MRESIFFWGGGVKNEFPDAKRKEDYQQFLFTLSHEERVALFSDFPTKG